MTVEYVSVSDWWRRALAGERVQLRDGLPEAGYYRTKIVRGGPWVPARIWIERERDDDGEQMHPDTVRCIVDGREADGVQLWVRLSSYPISATEYERMRRDADPLPSNRPITLGAMPALF